jgi:hypothetical protein
LCWLSPDWLLWMFGLGRYRVRAAPTPSGDSQKDLSYVVANFFVTIITEFRHLLALVIVVLFAGTLVLAMWPGIQRGDVALVKDGLQAVAAVMGGLIGSIIGYYFGESKGRSDSATAATPSAPPEQGGTPGRGAPDAVPPPEKPTISPPV